MYFHRIIPSLVVAFALVASPAFAQGEVRQDTGTNKQNATATQSQPSSSGDEQANPPRTEGDTSTDIFSLLPTDSVTDHVLKTRTQELTYTATAGTLSLFGQDGARTAKIFYTAYVARNRQPGRPLTFAFNGGPGAASAYLHLGLVGPRILDFGPNGQGGTSPTLVDNPDSWLEFTDLVLIDPVSTGWSRAASVSVASNFYGVGQDAESIAKTIALYVNHNERMASPKYLLGESYGGFRAAKVASALKDDQGILVSGIIMLSPLIEGQLLFGASQYPLGAALQLPSLAAAELERRKAFSLNEIREAEQFAMTDYLVTLAGPEPSGNKAKAFYARVSQLTGIPEAVVSRTRGFLTDAYVKHSKSDEFEVVSPYDASFAVSDPYPESDADRSNDPVLDGFTRAYGAAFASYARNELGFRTELTYTLLAENVNDRWKWSRRGENGGTRAQASATDDIRDLLSVIPSFHLLVAQGYSDAITPYGISKYVIDHLPSSLAAGRVGLKLYRGGHMFYTRPSSRHDLSTDARGFFSGQMGKAQGE
ncbi:carboxypeptidase [Phyllobacterium sp. LjRoot231]|uniref:S10 family peptidase n=1 Tax=Phyllobacterium sp. LjRoot231 TaxID=3342289 RepID=UPI003ECCB89A